MRATRRNNSRNHTLSRRIARSKQRGAGFLSHRKQTLSQTRARDMSNMCANRISLFREGEILSDVDVHVRDTPAFLHAVVSYPSLLFPPPPPPPPPAAARGAPAAAVAAAAAFTRYAMPLDVRSPRRGATKNDHQVSRLPLCTRMRSRARVCVCVCETRVRIRALPLSQPRRLTLSSTNQPRVPPGLCPLASYPPAATSNSFPVPLSLSLARSFTPSLATSLPLALLAPPPATAVPLSQQ